MGTTVDLTIDLQRLAIFLHGFIMITAIDLIQSDVAERCQQIDAAFGLCCFFQLIGCIEVIYCLLELAELLVDGTQHHVDVCTFRLVLLQIQLQNVQRSTIFLLGLLIFLESEVAIAQHRQHNGLLLTIFRKTSCAFLEHILEIIDRFTDPSISPRILTHLIQHTTFLSDRLPLTLRILDTSQDVYQTRIVLLIHLLFLLLPLSILFSRVYLHSKILWIHIYFCSTRIQSET